MSFNDTAVNTPTGATLYRPVAKVEAGTSYARVTAIAANGRILLATCEAFELHAIPIFESIDGGRTWSRRPSAVVSEPTHGLEGWSLIWQPTIFADGTRVLLSATSILRGQESSVLGTRILLFESIDDGRTWTLLSTVVEGSEAEGNVWEPELQRVGDAIVAYYSTEGHQPAGLHQAIAHKVSADGGATWGEEVLDIYAPDGHSRPGMAIVRQVADGAFHMVYEVCDANGGHCRLYEAQSDDGTSWPSDPHVGLVGESETRYLHSTPAMKVDGDRLYVTGMGAEGYENRVILTRSGSDAAWTAQDAPVQWQGGNDHAGYSQALLSTDRGILHIASSSRVDVVNELLYAFGEHGRRTNRE